MNEAHLVRVELRRLRRTPALWIGTLGLTLVVFGGTQLPRLGLESPEPSHGVAFLLGPGVELVLPVLAILVSYNAIAGRRVTGNLRFLLGTPLDRTEILLATQFARAIAVGAVALTSVVLATVGIWLTYGRPPLFSVLQFGLVTVYASVAFVAIGVSLSALVRTHVRALALAMGGLLVGHALWEPLWRTTARSIHGSGTDPGWLGVILGANPLDAYTTLADGVLPPSPYLDIAVEGDRVATDSGAVVGSDVGTIAMVGAVGAMALWAIGLTAIARYRFQRTELG